MDFALTPRQQAVADRARAFACNEVAPLARQADATGTFPLPLVKRLGEEGFLAGPVAADYGGSELDYVTFAQVYAALGYADSAVRGFLSVHGGLVTLCIRDHGTADQQIRWLPRLATGEVIGCYALTEPGAGSDAANIATTARRDGEAYVLDGEKTWITNGNIAHLALVFARDPDIVTDRPHRQLCAFLIPTDSPGFRRQPMSGLPLGHRAADHANIHLTRCRVPAAALLGPAGGGFRVAMGALDHGRLGVAAGALGVAEACLDATVAFCRARHAFGRRIGDFGMIQATLADVSAEVEAARHLVNYAAWRKDQALPSTQATATAKLFATEVALRAADQAVLIHGGRGYSNEHPVERYLRDAKGMQIYEGTSHIQRVVIAREILGREG